MSQVLIGVTLGTPNTAGSLPLTSSNIVSLVAQAVTDTTALATAISAASTLAGTSTTDAGTTDTDVATVVTDATAADTDVATVQTDIATTGTDYDSAAATIVTVFNGGSGTYTYSTTTKQFSGAAPAGGVTVSQANFTAITNLLNTMATALLLAKTDAATAKTATALTITVANTAKTASAAGKTAATAASTAVAALSTSTVAADHTAIQGAGVSPENLIVHFDTSSISHVGPLSGALVSALAFAQSASIVSP